MSQHPDRPAPALDTTDTFPARAPAPALQEPWLIASSSLHLPGARLHQPQTCQLSQGDLHQLALCPRKYPIFQIISWSQGMPKLRPFPVPGEQHQFLVFFLRGNTRIPAPSPLCQLLPACKDLPQRDRVEGFGSAWKCLLRACTWL